MTNGLSSLTRAVLRVGDGRGFMTTRGNHLGHEDRIIITAAHCLPFLRSCHPARYLNEETYKKLLGPIGGKRSVWASCLLVDG